MHLKLYLATLFEILIFILIGFTGAHYGLRMLYELLGIEYIGNIGIISFALAFFLLCSFTIVRVLLFKRKTILLNERMHSITFWLIYILSVSSLILPFISRSI